MGSCLDCRSLDQGGVGQAEGMEAGARRHPAKDPRQDKRGVGSAPQQQDKVCATDSIFARFEIGSESVGISGLVMLWP